MSSNDQNVIPLVFLAVVVVWGLIIKWRYPKTKPVTLEEVADRLGLEILSHERNKVLQSYGFINRLQYGNRQHAGHALRGDFQGYRVTVLEMRYETASIVPDRTMESYTFYLLQLPIELPEVTVYREGLISKLVQNAGHVDIGFESYEFSRKFRVRASKPKHAYDVCNARMIEYLLKNTDLNIEIDQDTLCMSFNKPLRFDEIEKNLIRLVKIRKLIPNYLLEG